MANPFDLKRLRRKEIWGLPLLALIGVIYAFMSFLLDVVLLDQWSPYWLLIFVVTFGVVVSFGWFYRAQVLNRYQVESAWLNVLVAGILGSIKNVLVAPMAMAFGLLAEPLYPFRFIGGFTLGAGVFVFSGLALGARAEHTAIMAQLAQVQATLLSLRSSSKARLAEASNSLISQTRDLLLPKLEQIQKLVGLTGDSGKAIENLRQLIQEDVRPLSEALSRQAANLVEVPVVVASLPKRFKLLRPQVELRGLIRPNAAAISAGLGGLMLAYAIMGAPRCNKVLYLSVISWVVAWVVRLLIPAGSKVSSRAAIWFLVALGLVMAAPMYLIALTEIEDPSEPWLLLTIVPSTLVSLLLWAYAESLDRDRVAARAVLEAENQVIAHDQALFEQQLWLGRRAWQFVVHGTVQSALTAALTRLQLEAVPEPYILTRVSDDIDRARKALMTTPSRKIDLVDSLSQMQATWRGICDIRVNITERAGRSLLKNNDACLCVNEILKEAVSNAVRHGEAKNISIEIDRHEDFDLEIVVTNDGVPLAKQTKLGVGSRLIEELTTCWSLTSNKATGLTVFMAKLPLQRS